MAIELPQIFTYALGFSTTFKYLLLFIGVIVEGPILMVVCGFFLRLGVLDLLPVFLVLFAGDLLADSFWYFVGARFGERFFEKHGGLFGLTTERFVRVKELFHRFHDGILFISKVTIGFGMAIGILVVAGASRLPFRRFMFLNALGEVVLVSTLLAIGYMFGELYGTISEGFREVFAIGTFILAGVVIYGFANFMRLRLSTKYTS